ncbi:MAG: sulfatase [Phycisphaerae bacterium]|nr:MAG: sulfatase-like hydrolase/transferase [Phycisphaerae bacterium]MBE7456888.1 sulfatase [Planctomycetia bacterium]MCK6464335.1 sulfatase-like hydrolase/transferase [Phycisphaerae bacterium]MCL4717928.1 sulfatase [Phycisphaerae bacterium]NUQ07445.1 sulfatase [Phycisphaerae bacterium]
MTQNRKRAAAGFGRGGWLGVVVAAGAALAAWDFCAAQSTGGKPNLLIITIDTMRADHLGCYGYFRDTSPHIDALAKESIFFERCITPMAQTLPVHTSIFTGVYPREHGIVANIAQGGLYKPSDTLMTFASAVAKQGYHTAGFVSAEPVKKIGGIAAGFEYWYEPADKKVEADWTNKKIFEWADGGGLKEPFFMWVHYFDPHANYEPPPPYDTMFTSDEALDRYMRERGFGEEGTKERSGDKEKAVVKVKKSKESINLYDGEVRWTDENIGKLFAKLKEKGVWDKTIIVITGDHGEGLGQHNLTGHGNIWHEQLHVPLMMRIPGQAPRKVATPITSPDILPTLLALVPTLPAGDFLKQTTGVNVLAPDHKADRPLYAQLPGSRTVMVQSLTVGDWRYIMHPKGDRLFNLKDDPYELKNVLEQNKERATQMRKELERIVHEQMALGQKHGGGQILKNAETSKAVRNLEGLGYGEEGTEEDDHPEYDDGHDHGDEGKKKAGAGEKTEKTKKEKKDDE